MAEHLGDLARTLHNLGARQFELDRYEEALATAKQAVAVRREVMRTSPPTYRASLGMSLVGYASVCVPLKAELPEALDAVREALALYQTLLEFAPEAVRPHLLPALHTLADVHEAMGNDKEAQSVRQAITATRIDLLEPADVAVLRLLERRPSRLLRRVGRRLRRR